jgi:uncharacterized protein
MSRLALVAAAALAFLSFALPTVAQASVPAGAKWQEVQITSANGVKLHADILRPQAAVDSGTRTPVILSIGPYFNHSGQTGPSGPVENTPYDPIGPSSDSPSDRFKDFIDGAHLMDKGYTFVMVDLRGFGGSTGCLDWGGPGEQSDVQSAVTWAANQPWSTGKVGMYGKSYDAATGLIGVDKKPQGLDAVVSQEPVYDFYRYLYGDGIRRENSGATPALYNAISLTPGPLMEPGYNLNATDVSRPACQVQNQIDQTGNPDHSSAYWKARNLIPGAQGSNVPLFLTQGLTENNTVADGTAQFLQNHTGPERAWLGPWEHVRGNETCAPDDSSTGCSDHPVGTLKEGRAGWFDEVMRFYDHYLKGGPAEGDPPIAVQTNDGKWRAEQSWPPADAKGQTTTLKTGSYMDDGNGGYDDSDADGVWTISPPLAHDAHLAGSGKVTLDLTGPQNGNVVVDVYDLSDGGSGTLTGPLITRQGSLVKDGKLSLDLWSADWKLAAGHRIGVRVTDANGDWWIHVPSLQNITVNSGSVTLPFLTQERTGTIQGDKGVQLDDYLSHKVTVSAATATAAGGG